MRNLLENVLRHTPAGGEVTLQAHVSNDETVMTVTRRSAGGIAEADLARVFELGYRGDAARSPGPIRPDCPRPSPRASCRPMVGTSKWRTNQVVAASRSACRWPRA